MSNDSVTFFGGGPGSAKFDKPGTTVRGKITEEPVMQQQTTPEGKLKTWDNGDPMLQLVVTIQTDERDPNVEDDDGIRRLYIKGQMRTAVQQALREAGSKGLDVGGDIAVTYTHDGERTNPAFSPPKQYEASYVKPKADQAGFFGNEAVSSNTANVQQPANGSESLPPGMTAEVWATLTPEARAALASLSSK